MSNKIMEIIAKEKAKCRDENLLALITSELQGGTPIDDIAVMTHMTKFDLGPYIETAFADNEIDPSLYCDKNKYNILSRVLADCTIPLLSTVKNRVPNVSYEDVRIARGVYYRENHISWRNKAKQKKEEAVNNTSATEKTANKIDLDSIPAFRDIIYNLKTEHWRQFAISVFTEICPKQFFVMPAAMSKGKHNISEYSYGKVEGNKVVRMGGKAFHTLRVCDTLFKILETDSPEIKSYNKTTKYVYGNEYTDTETDIMILAALCHDIYSGGTEEEFDSSRRTLDYYHPYYHRKTFTKPQDIPEDEWETFLTIIENHMWKWSPREIVSFHSYEDKNKYRMIKNVELSDYLAAQRNPQYETQVLTVLKLLAAENEIRLSEAQKRLEILGITDKILTETFGHNDLIVIAKSMGIVLEDTVSILGDLNDFVALSEIKDDDIPF